LQYPGLVDRFGNSDALGVEIEDDLLPAGYEAQEGDRVAVYGRWIADAGHLHTTGSDGSGTVVGFHTEIHPYLLMGVARAQQGPGGTRTDLASAGRTRFTLISRPYLTSQLYPLTGGSVVASVTGSDASVGEGLDSYANSVAGASDTGALVGAMVGASVGLAGGVAGLLVGAGLGAVIGALWHDAVNDLAVGPFVFGDPNNSPTGKDANGNNFPLPNVSGYHDVAFFVRPPDWPPRSPNESLHITGAFHCRPGSWVEFHPVTDPSGVPVALWIVVHLRDDQLQPIPPSTRRTVVRSTVELNSLYPFEGGKQWYEQWVINNIIAYVDFYEYDALTFEDAENGYDGGARFEPQVVDIPVEWLGLTVATNPVKWHLRMPWPVYGWCNLYWGPAAGAGP
jgi:hypothetical protein